MKLLGQRVYMFLGYLIHILAHCFPERLCQGLASQKWMKSSFFILSPLLPSLFGSVGLLSPCCTSKPRAVGMGHIKTGLEQLPNPSFPEPNLDEEWKELGVTLTFSVVFYESSFSPSLSQRDINLNWRNCWRREERLMRKTLITWIFDF